MLHPQRSSNTSDINSLASIASAIAAKWPHFFNFLGSLSKYFLKDTRVHRTRLEHPRDDFVVNSNPLLTPTFLLRKSRMTVLAVSRIDLPPW